MGVPPPTGTFRSDPPPAKSSQSPAGEKVGYSAPSLPATTASVIASDAIVSLPGMTWVEKFGAKATKADETPPVLGAEHREE